MRHTVTLSLGSNQGDRLAFFNHALSFLQPLLYRPQLSSIYETPALLPPNAPPEWDIPYLNMALNATTDIADPLEFLHHTQLIEQHLGRAKQHDVWSPRVIDIDIITWDIITLQTEPLTLPHPRAHERLFVLAPLAEIAPELRLNNQTASQHLARLLAEKPLKTYGITRTNLTVMWP